MWESIENIFSVTPVSYAGSIASIAGFALTIAIFLRVENIRKEYLSRARMPQIAKQLKQRASSISELVRDYPDQGRDTCRSCPNGSGSLEFAIKSIHAP